LSAAKSGNSAARSSPDFTSFNPGYTREHTSSFSRHDTPEVCKIISPRKEEARATSKKEAQRDL
jgi:hypothetical protein